MFEPPSNHLPIVTFPDNRPKNIRQFRHFAVLCGMKLRPVHYLIVLLLGLGIGLLFAFRTYLGYMYWNELEHYQFYRHSGVHVINYLTWGLIFPLFYYLFRRFRWSREASAGEKVMFILSCVLVGALHELISNVLYYGLLFQAYDMPWEKAIENVRRSLVVALFTRIIEYWILYAIVTGIEFQKKYKDKQIELAQLENKFSGAQLNALRLQLQPHFLFNTLNTIASLMEIDVKEAQKIISKLGALLRAVLLKNQSNQTDLQGEIDFIKSYLDIEQVRFHDRLEVRYQIDERTLDAEVPSLLLQPLVENAIKHGFSKNPEQGLIEVISKRLQDEIQLIVRDNGSGSPHPKSFLLSNGIGLRNIKERLDLLYGGRYHLDIETGENMGFAIAITLPYHKKTA